MNEEQIQAEMELKALLTDLNGPYFNKAGKFSKEYQDHTIERANQLRMFIADESSPDDDSDEVYEVEGEPLEICKEDAQCEIDKVMGDIKHPYWGGEGVSIQQQNLEVARIDRLRQIAAGQETSLRGYVTEIHEQKEEVMKLKYGPDYKTGKHSASGGWSPFVMPDIHNSPEGVGYGEQSLKSAYKNNIEDDSED